jgi:GntR family transcriptional regulator of arabinose operon
MTPKYKLLADKIIEYINNDPTASRKLPTERQLAQMYDVSRQTVREALNILLKEKYIYKRRGSGIYISDAYFSARNRIALIVPAKEDYIWPFFISELKQSLASFGYSLDVFGSSDSRKTEREILLSMEDSFIRAIISVPVRSSIPNPNIRLYDQLSSKHIPTLFITDVYQDAAESSYVKYDDFYAVYRLTGEILSDSDEIYGIFLSDTCCSLERYNGYVQAMLESGINPEDENILWLNCDHLKEYRKSGRIDAMNKFIKRFSQSRHINTALICHNDEIAAAFTDMFSREETLPAIYSFDNSYLCRLDEYSMVSLSVPVKELTDTIAKQAVMMITEKKSVKTTLLPQK